MSSRGRRRYCVFRCSSDLGAYMHGFPHPERRAEMFKKWVSAVGNKLTEKDPMKIFKNKKVCSYHFTLEERVASHRLKNSAIPSLHLEGLCTSPSIWVQLEHNYWMQGVHTPVTAVPTNNSLMRIPEPGVPVSHPRVHPIDTAATIPRTSSPAEQRTLDQLEGYEVETMDDTVSETSEDENCEHASDSNSESSNSSLRKKELQDFEECVIETAGLDQPNADDQLIENSVKQPPSWWSVKDVCRACLSKSGAWDLAETYLTEDGENERLLDMLTLCYGIKLSNVSQSSPSRFLCDTCAASVRLANNFRRQVLRAETNFTAHYGAGDDEIKEEYPGSDEDECLEKEVSCKDKSTESMDQDTQASVNISISPDKGSTKTASNHSMREVSYSEKYVRVMSYSATKNVKNNSANKEINIETQPVEEFEKHKETSNASHCEEDLLFSKIKTRKIGHNDQPFTQSMPKKSKNALQTVKRDSIDLRQFLEMSIPVENVMTNHRVLETNPKTVKRKTTSDVNNREIDLNVTNTITHPENLVQQSVGSGFIDLSQSIKLTLPGNKVMRFLPL